MRKLFFLVQKKKHANKTANSALKKDKYAIRPAMRSCLLHLMRQNRFLKTFLANLISMTQISLFLLVMIWKSAIFTVNPKLGKKFTKSLDLSKVSGLKRLRFPDCLKASSIVSEFKNVTGRFTDKNYHSISVPFVVSKIFEKNILVNSTL